jgi:hypothetical protein
MADLNMNELLKLGAFELIMKHVQGEEKNPRREGLLALTSLVANGIL